MAVFILRRTIYMIVTLFFISIVGFAIINLTPGSALDVKIEQIEEHGGQVSDAEVAALRHQYGLDKPVPLQYLSWVGGVLHGDFGTSITYNTPVGQLIWGRIAWTLGLSVSALIFAWVVAIPVGVYSATHRYSLPDYAITVIQFVGVAIPEFLLALVLLVGAADLLGQHNVGGLFSAQYQNAPLSPAKIGDGLGHLWIPVIVIAASSTAGLTRLMRANLLDVLNYQYVQTARSKGLQEGLVIWKHAVRNALHPLVMSLGTSLPALLSGEVIVSIVLNLPTDGPLYFEALTTKDEYLAISFLVLTSALLVVGNLLADLALVWLDPRVRPA